jgi:hypothetical protein
MTKQSGLALSVQARVFAPTIERRVYASKEWEGEAGIFELGAHSTDVRRQVGFPY